MRGVDFPIWISPRIRSQKRNGLKGSVRDLGQSELCKNIGKNGSLPCPFNNKLKIQALKKIHKNYFSRLSIAALRYHAKFTLVYSPSSCSTCNLKPNSKSLTGGKSTLCRSQLFSPVRDYEFSYCLLKEILRKPPYICSNLWCVLFCR